MRCFFVGKGDVVKDNELLKYFDEICGEETDSEPDDLADSSDEYEPLDDDSDLGEDCSDSGNN